MKLRALSGLVVLFAVLGLSACGESADQAAPVAEQTAPAAEQATPAAESTAPAATATETEVQPAENTAK